MSSTKTYSRREILRGAVAGTVVVLPVLVGCGKKELECNQVGSLSAADIATRNTLAYSDKALDPAKPCEACQLFAGKGGEVCGGCTVVKGPIHPKGGCTAWVKKAA